MNTKTTYDFLDNNPDNNQNRLALINFLKDSLPLLKNDKDYYTAVYNMAGMMSTKYVQSLSDDDIISQILGLAGELEAPDDDSENKLKILIDFIVNL